ncbi:tetraspanin Tsp2 [Mycena epipterygia]|nr:tetraspanin Tsp2 [Mycena epipterygia]
MQRVWSVYLDGKRKSVRPPRNSTMSDANSMVSQSASTRHMLEPHPLEPPRAPFFTDGASSSRSSSPGPTFDGSTMSLQINYTPSKFSPGVRQRFGGNGKWKGPAVAKRGGGVDAFRAGEARMPKRRAKWNKFKWILVFMNTVYTVVALAAFAFILTAWFDVWENADIVRVGNRTELILSTLAASMALFTALIGWAGIVLNNRGFLAVYTFFLWIAFVLLVIPGYITYKKHSFNLEGKVNKQWSTGLGGVGRLRIQNQLGCCGYFSPFVEATVSATCYSRSILPGCKKAYWDFEKIVLKRWYVIAFGCVPVNILTIVAGLLCSNHITYRFGKGMMPKAYRLSEKSMAVIVSSYASQLAEQYGPEMAEDIMARSRSNLNLDAIPVMAPGSSNHRD